MSALTGLRIVELAESVAGEYRGKLLADFGADVVKAERPGLGSPTRVFAPVTDGDGAVFGYLNTNKRPGAVDDEIGTLTARFGAAELAARLQAAGVPAAKSATAVDVIGDDLLWRRGAFRFVSDHREGQRPVLGPSWRMRRDPARIERGAPDLGEDNEHVFGEILGGRRAET